MKNLNAYGEKGIAYMVGGAIPDAAVAWFTKGGSVAVKSTKTAEHVLDAVDDVADSLPDVKYSPINPGPLDEQVAESFNGATYTKKVLTEDTKMYRVYGGNANEVGGYLSKTPQNGGLQSQLDLALSPSWGNSAENIVEVVVPKGTTIYEGSAAPQIITDSLGNSIGYLPGGGNQIFIPGVSSTWLIK